MTRASLPQPLRSRRAATDASADPVVVFALASPVKPLVAPQHVSVLKRQNQHASAQAAPAVIANAR
eukprot:EC718590.1.p3 GENE.EC718590.1~~EC718590.1.p3  ORF type:complete len:66 (+),score=4.60 EC718590.1:112-309(+)